MTAISVEEAHAILGGHDLIAIGVRADEERRRRHGIRTSFGRVFEIHVEAVPATLPSSIDAGEVRLTGTPGSLEAAATAVRRARTLAGSTPLTGFSLVDLLKLADESLEKLRAAFDMLKNAGLEIVADVPVDKLSDPIDVIRAARDAGLRIPRLTVHELDADQRVESVERAREIQAAVGGIVAFAPLPRTSSIAQPSTGYDDVKQIAIARLLIDNIDSIQVDWTLYGPKLAQVALTMGADDVDGVSAMEGDLGRRRSPIEQIRGNIRAAGLEPVERDGLFGVRG
jgi:aminodeoxyfutalosine synthase